MTFTIDKDVIQDMIALFGKEQAIEELVQAYRVMLQETVLEIEGIIPPK